MRSLLIYLHSCKPHNRWNFNPQNTQKTQFDKTMRREVYSRQIIKYFTIDKLCGGAKMFKKILVICLAMVMVLTMVPAVAFAAPSTSITSFDDINAAIDAIPYGGSGEITIKDLHMMGLEAGLWVEGKDITFNFVNSGIYVNEGPVLFAVDSNITINMDDESKLASNNSDGYAGVIRVEDWNLSDEKNYTLTLNGGQYVSENNSCALAASTDCTIVIDKAVVQGGLNEAAATSDLETGNIVINAGRFTVDTKDFAADGKYSGKAGDYYYVRDTEYTDEYLAAIPNGQVVFNYVYPQTEEDLWLPVDDFWNENYEKGIDVALYVDSISKDFLTGNVILHEGKYNEEVHTVDLVWNYDADIYEATQKLVEKFPKDREWFIVKDLEFVNYLVNSNLENDGMGDTLANYSSELKGILDNYNYTLLVDVRAGSDDPFCTENVGFAKFLQDGVVYHVTEPLGARAEHVIYVPDDTADTPEALMAAAEKRVTDYFGKDIIDIQLSDYTVEKYKEETLADYDAQLAEAEAQIPALKARMDELQALIDEESCKENPDQMLIEQYTVEHSNTWFTLTDYEWIAESVPDDIKSFNDNFKAGGDYEYLSNAAGGYIFDVSFNGSVYYQFIIIKDSSQMITPTYKTVDYATKVEINTEDSSVPLDTIISADVLTSGTEYDRIKGALNEEKIYMYDLSLYSSTTGQNVSKLENGEFQVKIPVPAGFDSNDMTVYYVDADNKVTEHAVTIENSYVTFTTDHFSIYTLAISSNAENGAGTVTPEQTPAKPDVPPTGDNNMMLLWASVAILGAAGLTVSRKRKEQ